MLNAIFHCDSTFLDQRPDGSLEYRLGSKPSRLEGGISITPLEEKQPLFRIETESGAGLTLSPESVFSLRKTPDGKLVRYLPVDEAYRANPPRLDWRATVHGIDKSDIRRFALVGLLVANGTHSTDRSRPSNITLGNLDIAEDVSRFLEAVANDQDYGSFGRTRRPTVRFLEDGTVFIKSRTLTHAASWLIEPKTQELSFDPLALGRNDLFAFAFGLINGAAVVGNYLVIKHRSISTLRLISRMLELRFGVSANVSEAAFTREEVSDKLTQNHQHTLVLDETAMNVARYVGLYGSNRDCPAVSPYRAEGIVKIETIPAKSHATIVTGVREGYPYPLAVNSFVFDAEFVANGALIDLSAHPQILTDPSDPASLLESSPVHLVQGKRINA